MEEKNFFTHDFQTQQKIYQEMKLRNSQIIKLNKIKFDSSLKTSYPDKRKCLAMFSFLKSIQNSKNLEELYSDLSKVKNICLYKIDNKDPSSGTLHFTLLQILGFYYLDEWLLDVELRNKLESYIKEKENSLKDILAEILPFRIHYKGVILTPSGLVLCGYPDKNINFIRDKLRLLFSDIIKEPYYNNIIHSTISRFTDFTDSDFAKLKEIEEKYSDLYLGYTDIDSMFVGYGTWKLNDYETTLITSVF